MSDRILRDLRVPDFRNLGSRPRTSRPRNLQRACIKNSKWRPTCAITLISSFHILNGCEGSLCTKLLFSLFSSFFCPFVSMLFYASCLLHQERAVISVRGRFGRLRNTMDLTETTTATATSPNKRFNEQNNDCARALKFFVPIYLMSSAKQILCCLKNVSHKD